MERVIDVKLHNNSGGLVDLEKKIYDVLVIDDNHVKRMLNVDLDNPKLQEYLRKFEKYLTSKKDMTISRALENTGKKRLRNNLIASPFYITSFGALILSLMGVPEIIGIPLFFASLGVGISSVMLANMRSLYTNPEDEKVIQLLEVNIGECKKLQNEMEKVLINKQEIKEEVQEVVEIEKRESPRVISVKDVTPEREKEKKQIYEEAMKTKGDIAKKSKFDYSELYSRMDAIEQLLNERRTSYPRGISSDVPDYLKKSR